MKKSYVVPNILTALNLFCGLMAVVLVIEGDFVRAAHIIFIAMLFDCLDGQVARKARGTSKFGLEFDSLADLVSFGVAPAVLLYALILKEWEPWGFMLTFFYLLCCALRLARFNLYPVLKKKSFIGLPSPAAAGVIASLLLLVLKYEWLPEFTRTVPSVILILSFLMVSKIEYPMPNRLPIWKLRITLLIPLCAVGIVWFIRDTEIVATLLFCGYMVYGFFLRVRLVAAGRKDVEEKEEAVFLGPKDHIEHDEE